MDLGIPNYWGTSSNSLVTIQGDHEHKFSHYFWVIIRVCHGFHCQLAPPAWCQLHGSRWEIIELTLGIFQQAMFDSNKQCILYIYI